MEEKAQSLNLVLKVKCLFITKVNPKLCNCKQTGNEHPLKIADVLRTLKNQFSLPLLKIYFVNTMLTYYNSKNIKQALGKFCFKRALHRKIMLVYFAHNLTHTLT